MGSICYGYMCILLYMKPMQCNGFPEIYAQLGKGMESLCHGYMGILLYMKLICCNGFPEIYGQFEEGGMGSVCTGICAFFYISNIVAVVVFHRSKVNWRSGEGVNLPWVYVHSAIYETYLLQWFSRNLWSIGGGRDGVCLH